MNTLPAGYSSSGDVAIDRRYRWAKASLEAGEAAEACDILRQAIADAPSWAPAWKLLGDALLRVGEVEEAHRAYEKTERLDPSGILGAELDLARLGRFAPAEAMRPAYVTALFDDYADRFDAHLTGVLAYRGPGAILESLRLICDHQRRELRFERALDLGCGTGLMGEAIRSFVADLAGVDLSPLMLAKARAKLIYDRLAVGDLLAFLRGEPAASFDLVLAADVLVYVADLAPIFSAVATKLGPQGLFAFTLQAAKANAADGFVLGQDNRFSHAPDYVRATAAASSLAVADLASTVTRQDGGADVPGLVVVLEGCA
jgi:predicted TPR repeat methyltransferase